MCFEFLNKYRNAGFLILRLGIGGMFIFHGFGKLSAGPEVWTKLGSALSYLGINFAPKAFGLMAALSEFVGGICLILGLFFRPACFFLLCTMIVATTMHLSTGDGIKGASHAIEAGVLFLSLIFIGPGAYNLDDKLCKKK
jgi:putative oxidoreductase